MKKFNIFYLWRLSLDASLSIILLSPLGCRVYFKRKDSVLQLLFFSFIVELFSKGAQWNMWLYIEKKYIQATPAMSNLHMSIIPLISKSSFVPKFFLYNFVVVQICVCQNWTSWETGYLMVTFHAQGHEFHYIYYCLCRS